MLGANRQRIAPITTVLDPTDRTRVDAAGAGLYRTIHRDCVDEVLRDLKERRISAVVVSVSRCIREDTARVAAVVREFPRIPTVALLSGSGEADPAAVLTLGNCGVRTLIDVRNPTGWHRLRDILGAGASRDTDHEVVAVLRGDLDGVSADCWIFFEALFSPDFRVSSVRQLAACMHVLPSTLMSRFFRARLPAPKKYLAYARLIRAARLFENPGLSVADVANHLDYSSPQSFGRHIHTLLHMTAGEFRRRYDGSQMLRRFREELVLPYYGALRSLRPLAARPGMRLIPPPHLLGTTIP